MIFQLGKAVEFRESLTCEFKEIKKDPRGSIKQSLDKYVVAYLNSEGGSIYWGISDVDRIVRGFEATDKLRSQIQELVGQAIAGIAPQPPARGIVAPFHEVVTLDGKPRPNWYVFEVRVTKPPAGSLYLSEAGMAYRKTISGAQKLSGAQLLLALQEPFAKKLHSVDKTEFVGKFPSVARRVDHGGALIRNKRALWIDDNPSWTFYERLALSEMGVHVDVATTTREGLVAVSALKPDIVISDIVRNKDKKAGFEFLQSLRATGNKTPVLFYIADFDRALGVPESSFGITNRPDELLHLVMDVLERGG